MIAKKTFFNSGIERPAKVLSWEELNEFARYFFDVRYLGNHVSDESLTDNAVEYAVFRYENCIYCVELTRQNVEAV